MLLLLVVFSGNSHAQLISRTADGFTLPVAPPEGAGFYKSRGFRAGGHLGEDWVTDGGSNKGLGRPVYGIGNGIVVLARDVRVAWGNVVVIRHAWIESHQLKFADSLYAHLDRISVREGQQISKGQQVGTIGTNHGMYPPHLHFEIHRDLSIGVNHAAGTRDLRSYWLPTEFIMARRQLAGGGRNVPTPSANFLLPTADNPWSLGHFWHNSKKSTHGKSAKSSSSASNHSGSTSQKARSPSTWKVNRYTDH
ncbi:MAG: M23 family metallopeptidase [bacterium]